jgi:hypothetical protein
VPPRVLKKAARRKRIKPAIRYVTHDEMWAMKRARQARDRRAAGGGVGNPHRASGGGSSVSIEMLAARREIPAQPCLNRTCDSSRRRSTALRLLRRA